MERVYAAKTLKEAFAYHYAATLNIHKAAEAVGIEFQRGRQWARDDELVQELVTRKLEEHEKKADLDGAYIRQLLLDILELCPTDHFFLAPDGQWLIDPELFKALPHRVKRLVQRVESRWEKGVLKYEVHFMSKSDALALAAKFTLVEKHQVNVGLVPWDQVATADDGYRKLEQKLSAYQSNGVARPVQAS